MVDRYEARAIGVGYQVNSDSTEPRDERIGRANRENIKELLATAALYPLTQQTKSGVPESWMENNMANRFPQNADGGVRATDQ